VKKLLYLIAAIIVVGLVVMVFAGSFRAGGNKDVAAVGTALVTRRDIGATVLATGIVQPLVGAEVRVGSRVSGIVQRLYANIGDWVKKGQVIAELEPTELQAQYDQAQAAVETACANLEYARLELQRQKSLVEKSLISHNEFDLAQKSFEVNKAQYKQAQANLAYARVQLDYTKITAPISGVVASVSTQEGETVAASFSAPTFVNIIDLDRLEVWAYVDETDIGRIEMGQTANFTVDTYPDSDFEGVVTAIYPKAVIQDNVVNYVVTIKITPFPPASGEKQKILRPEMTANVTIFLEPRKGVLTIPLSAIKRENGERYVTVIDGDKMAPRKVRTGWSGNGYIEIIGGLNEGETIVVSK
jgi:macrolide-specific efflux system membrane fusion protein